MPHIHSRLAALCHLSQKPKQMEKNASSYVVCGCGSGNDSTGGSCVGNYILGLQFIGHSDMTSPRHKEHCMCNLTMYPATGCQKYSVNSTNTSMPR